MLKVFKSTVKTVKIIPLIALVILKPAPSYATFEEGEVFDYNVTTHIGRYHCPLQSTSEDILIPAYIYPTILTVTSIAFGAFLAWCCKSPAPGSSNTLATHQSDESDLGEPYLGGGAIVPRLDNEAAGRRGETIRIEPQNRGRPSSSSSAGDL